MGLRFSNVKKYAPKIEDFIGLTCLSQFSTKQYRNKSSNHSGRGKKEKSIILHLVFKMFGHVVIIAKMELIKKDFFFSFF